MASLTADLGKEQNQRAVVSLIITALSSFFYIFISTQATRKTGSLKMNRVASQRGPATVEAAEEALEGPGHGS